MDAAHPWLVHRPSLGASFLTPSNWTTRYTADVHKPSCLGSSFIDCVVDSSNSFMLHHFPHAAEAQLACWALFRHYYSLTPRFAMADGASLGGGAWSTGLSRLINATVVNASSATERCRVTSRLRRRASGWGQEHMLQN